MCNVICNFIWTRRICRNGKWTKKIAMTTTNRTNEGKKKSGKEQQQQEEWKKKTAWRNKKATTTTTRSRNTSDTEVEQRKKSVEANSKRRDRDEVVNAIRKRHTENDISTRGKQAKEKKRDKVYVKIVQNAGEKRKRRLWCESKYLLGTTSFHNLLLACLHENYWPNSNRLDYHTLKREIKKNKKIKQNLSHSLRTVSCRHSSIYLNDILKECAQSQDIVCL